MTRITILKSDLDGITHYVRGIVDSGCSEKFDFYLIANTYTKKWSFYLTRLRTHWCDHVFSSDVKIEIPYIKGSNYFGIIKWIGENHEEVLKLAFAQLPDSVVVGL